jgi:hypothetical protein
MLKCSFFRNKRNKLYFIIVKYNMTYGFIILRHVNSIKTNKYWNQSVKLIRTYYPNKKIVIIDDNSKQELVVAEANYDNVEIIQSLFPGRGELLPFLYFYKHKWFENAVILHDSVFIHMRLNFDKITDKVLPFWHFNADKDHINTTNNIIQYLNHKHILREELTVDSVKTLGKDDNKWFGCFGGQCYINHSFLSNIVIKYNMLNLTNVIKNREYRCGFERIIGIIFCLEDRQLRRKKSLFGDIFIFSNSLPNYKWGYTYEEYENSFYKNKLPLKPFIKVWTGR